MQNTTNIYGLYSSQNPSNIRYIGKTVSTLNHRLKSHVYDSKKADSHKDRWIRKEISNHYSIEIKLIDIVPTSDWQFWEKYYISKYRKLGFKLTNTQPGGNDAGMPITSKALVVLDKKGKYIEKYFSIGETSRQLNINVTHIEKCLRKTCHRKTAKGYQFIYETEYDKNKDYAIVKKPPYQKMTKEQFSESQRLRSLKAARKSRKPVYQYDINNNLLTVYTCRKDVIDKNPHLKLSGLTKCIYGERKSYYGYIWKY